MIDNNITPNEEVVAICQSALRKMLAETNGIVFSLVATVDGFEIASEATSGWDIAVDRIAAMASSGHALGDTVARELTAKNCNNVIIDADKLSVVFLAVPEFDNPPLILGAAATKSESLGTVLYAARNCVRQIGKATTTTI